MKCECCGQELPKEEKVIIRYKEYYTRPWSIDYEADFIKDATIETMEVPTKEIYTKDGKRYYHCVIGHGDSVELLVE